jgi:hypothetical protein
VLTDLHPSARSAAAGDARVRSEPRSVDARQVPRELRGVRTHVGGGEAANLDAVRHEAASGKASGSWSRSEIGAARP